jgi:ubiquinone/menaquinone biosynthesis C-methylase UbiE
MLDDAPNLWVQKRAQLPETYNQWLNTEPEWFEKHIQDGSKVIDLGCGDGRSISNLLSVNKKVDIVGVDHHPDTVIDTSEKFKERSNVQIIEADALSLPFPDNSFDVVLIMTFLANIENPDPLLEEIKRILNPKSFVLGSVFSEDALSERLKMYETISDVIESVDQKTGVVRFNSEKSVDTFSRQYSKEEIESLFERHGFGLVDIQKVSIGYNFVFKLSK